MNLADIVEHCHQFPLPIDFGATTQGKPSQPKRFAQIAKDRFDDAQALPVNVATEHGIDLLFHPLDDADLGTR